VAGIGFELRKVIGKGGLGSFVQVAFSGIMIVAGPWLMSILGITLIQQFISKWVGDAALFTATVIYSFAWSMVLFGGLHLIYTRIVADLLFEKKESLASGALVFFLVLVAAASLAVSLPVYFVFNLKLPRPGLYRLAAGLLFLSINSVWILMIFMSLLKRYILILLIYAAGIGVAVILVPVLSPGLGLEGALLGFAAGHLVIALLLALLAFSSHHPKGVRRGWGYLKTYVSRFWLLMATGFFYSWAMWVDKIIFWFSEGELIEGTFFRLYTAYDMAVYIANLSMIPGLVYFVIASETRFYIQLRKFLLTLARGSFAEIQARKLKLLTGLRLTFWQQSLFQGIITFSLFILAPAISLLFAPGQIEANTMRIVIAGVFFHFLSLTVMNYHFYLEFYVHAFVTAGIFFAVNAAVTVLMVIGYAPLLPGVGYAIGGLASAAYSYVAIMITGKRIDRRILAKSSGV
jgi:polysaccharide biosynthesis protein PelG